MKQVPLQADLVPTPRFHQAPRSTQRRARWWSRLGFIQRKLPQAISAAISELRLSENSRVLDFGCADQPYRALLPTGATYVGADLPGNTVADASIRADGKLDLPDASFDAVLSTQVLEHVADPALYLAECFRVLRPSGRLLLSTHGMMVYHPDPVDYWRWTGAGLERQVQLAGFVVHSFTGCMGLAATGLQLFQDALCWRLPRLLRLPFTLLIQLLIAFFDWIDTPRSRAQNALVFIVIAEKSPVIRPEAAPSAVQAQ